MAIHIHNTPSGVNEPGLLPIGLLRSCGAPCRVLSHGEMLSLLGEKPELPLTPLLGADLPRGVAGRNVDIDTPGLPQPVAGAALRSEECADLARAIHAREALEQALDHGAALLAALGLPRLVDDSFVPIDQEAAGMALADAMALLDAIDALAEDLEPLLGAPENHEPTTVRTGSWQWSQLPPDQRRWAQGVDDSREVDVVDEPHDGGDDELDLGWAANVSQVALGDNTGDGDTTAPERFGGGFVRCGRDDHEDDDPGGTDESGIGDLDGCHEQCGFAIAGALPWSVGGYVA